MNSERELMLFIFIWTNWISIELCSVRQFNHMYPGPGKKAHICITFRSYIQMHIFSILAALLLTAEPSECSSEWVSIVCANYSHQLVTSISELAFWSLPSVSFHILASACSAQLLFLKSGQVHLEVHSIFQCLQVSRDSRWAILQEVTI